MEGIRIFTTIRPSVNAAVGHHRPGELVLVEVIHEIQGVNHPLAGDPRREIPIQSEFEISPWIEGARRLIQEPSLPVRILFLNLLHLRPPTPPGTVIVPNDFDFRDFTERARIDELLGLARVSFTAVLRTNL